MKLPLRIGTALALLTIVAEGDGASRALASAPQSYALLVGCTRYPALEERYQLDGPGNDAVLMAGLLHARFHFPKENIVVLTEKAGGERGKDFLPTRANIEREFRSLAAKAKAGDRVVILLAGHGSQQPETDTDDPDHFEPDGLDEIFLPCDIGSWEDQKGRVKNAIGDNELRIWLKKIRAKKASVWVIVDACHAASMIRGTSDEKTRDVPVDKLVPRAAIAKAEERAREVSKAKGREGTIKPSPFKLPPAEPDLVAIYACQSTEPTVERTMPIGAKDRKPYGLLTYTICEILTQARTPLTYTELVQRIHAQYIAWGRNAPTPLVEGKDRDHEVLGDKQHPGRSRIRLEKDEDGGWKVDAGALHGLTAGTILAIFPAAGAADPDKKLGHVLVAAEGLAPLEAKVKPCAYEALPKPALSGLPRGGRCEVVFVNFGDQHLKLAIDPLTDMREKVPAAVLEALGQEAARAAREESALIQVVASPGAGAQWLLRLDSLRHGKVYLVPASGWSQPGPTAKLSAQTVVELPPLFGPIPEGEERVPWLRERLGRIARAQNLIALTGSSAGEPAGADNPVQVQVEMIRFRNKADYLKAPDKGETIRWQSGGVTLHKGDLVGFRVRNKGQEAIDISLLAIDSGYGIAPVFPRNVTTDNRIPPGETRHVALTRVTGDRVALEHLVVIAVKAREEAQYANFCFLAQPSIERARDIAGGAQRGRAALTSPLGQLFQKALYGQGKSRGLSSVDVDTLSLQLISWRVVPARPTTVTPQ